MEIDIDSVKWRDEFFTAAPVIEDGDYVLPTGPGWGVEVNEAAVREARPAQDLRHFSLTPTTRRMPSWMGTKPSSRSVCAIRYCG